jgi:hypothetical protein
MITKFKIFENNNVQQPVFLSKTDFLYLSDDLTKSILPTDFEMAKRLSHNQNFLKTQLKRKEYFISGKDWEDTYFNSKTKILSFGTYLSVSWRNNTYRMDLVVRSRGDNILNNNAGSFKFYLTGSSGDYQMHGKNMVRGTRDANMNFMIKMYPIVEYIKNFYKRLKNGELFFDIIKEAIINDKSLVKYGAPLELENDKDVGHYITGNKYNL